MEELFGDKRPEYPWQMDLPPWAAGAKQTEAERRAEFARFSFDFWKTLLDESHFEHPDLFYDEGPGFFRFSDGTFALSRERGNWPALKETGFFLEWGM
ncbi:MAG: hypothetical protein M3P49_13290 [Actinomycetota bacterium]|nr:hypothetical protein [Actinomycetota bacterium]